MPQILSVAILLQLALLRLVRVLHVTTQLIPLDINYPSHEYNS